MTHAITRRTFVHQTGVAIFGISLLRCGTHEVTPLTTGRSLPFLTPTAEHFVKNGAEGSIANWARPDIAPDRWRLEISGLVGRPLSVSLDDIYARWAQSISVLKTMQCVVDSNTAQGLVGTAAWRGVPLRLFLDDARIDRGRARRLHLFGADGFTGNLPLEKIDDPANQIELVEPLLVTEMNGLPLTRSHGAPVRLMIHDGFGYANVKWLVKAEATADDQAFGTYQDTGFTDESRVPVTSKVTAPLDNLSVGPGPLLIQGFSTSGHAGIAAVEIQVDGGPWVAADIAPLTDVKRSLGVDADAAQLSDPARFPYPYRAVWAHWSITWEATPGTHQIRVRAFDRAGNSQPERDIDISDGVNAYGAIRVKVST